jgi:ribulose bisphosphate carboxylase small subunit
MKKYCLACNVVIPKLSKQWSNQKYCTKKCKKIGNLKKKASKTRTEQKRANLRQNDEILYLVKQCRKAETVQILNGHNLDSFTKTMDLVRNRPPGDVNLCHIAPVKGKNSKGLFHHLNLFYGGAHQNKKFKNKYISGGLYISNKQLTKKWSVRDDMSTNDILVMIEEFLGDILPEYIEVSPVRKSKKVQIASKILELDESKDIDKLLSASYKCLMDQWEKISRIKTFSLIPVKQESKYLVYMDSLTRFISYGGDRVSTLKALRKLMVIGYMALERVEQSETHNKYFYVKYEPLISKKYGQAMLQNPDDWSVFKDLIYNAAFKVLQGGMLDIKEFRKQIMSYLSLPEKAWVARMTL